jgi:hypothetical protein
MPVAAVAELLSRRRLLAGLPMLPMAASSALAGSRDLARRDFAAVPKALWVWNFAPAQAAELAAFAARTGVSTLFVAFAIADRQRLLDGDPVMHAALRTLAQPGLEIWPLAGDPGWLDRPDSIPRPLALLIDIQKRHRLFAGLHLDIEPQAHRAWSSGRDAEVRLSQNLATLLATVKANAPGVAINAAVSPSLARLALPDGEDALARCCRSLSEVAIMAYRESAAATLAWAGPAIARAEAAGVPWRVGVLVHGSTEPHTSFAGLPKNFFRAEIIELDFFLRQAPSARLYKGLAFEDNAGFQLVLTDERESHP